MLACRKCGAIYVRSLSHCALDGERLLETAEDPRIGRVIDRYAVVSLLGEGGMARVYRATHAYLEQDFALKILHGDLAADRALARRFHREAKVLTKIRHDNVVRVADFGATKEGLLFMVMELVEGPTLAALLRRVGPLPPARAAAITRGLAAGLAAVHARGFVHRDMKPGNVVLVDVEGREVPKLLDFGLVGLLEVDKDTQLTQEGQVFGTPLYMSPEQITGQELDARSDLYSLGVVIYQMVTGSVPFTGDAGQLAQQHIFEAPSVPPLPYGGLRDLALELLQKKPADRPQSAEVVFDRLRELGLVDHGEVLRGHQPLRLPPPALEAGVTRSHRPPKAATLARQELPTDESVGVINDAAVEPDLDRSLRDALGLRFYRRLTVPLLFAVAISAGLAWTYRTELGLDAWAGRLEAAEPADGGLEGPDAEALASSPPPPRPPSSPPPSSSRPPPSPPPPSSSRPPPPSPPPSVSPPLDPPPPVAPPVVTPPTPPADAGVSPEPEDGPERSFPELDQQLGWVLSRRGLHFKDLMAAEPDASRQWARWFRQSAAPDPKELSRTFVALMSEAESMAVDESLLLSKLARVKRDLDVVRPAGRGARHEALTSQRDRLLRDVRSGRALADPGQTATEITLLENDAAGLAQDAAAIPPPPLAPIPTEVPTSSVG